MFRHTNITSVHSTHYKQHPVHVLDSVHECFQDRLINEKVEDIFLSYNKPYFVS